MIIDTIAPVRLPFFQRHSDIRIVLAATPALTASIAPLLPTTPCIMGFTSCAPREIACIVECMSMACRAPCARYSAGSIDGRPIDLAAGIVGRVKVGVGTASAAGAAATAVAGAGTSGAIAGKRTVVVLAATRSWAAAEDCMATSATKVPASRLGSERNMANTFPGCAALDVALAPDPKNLEPDREAMATFGRGQRKLGARSTELRKRLKKMGLARRVRSRTRAGDHRFRTCDLSSAERENS